MSSWWASTGFEPKKQFRGTVDFGGGSIFTDQGRRIPNYVKSFTKPGLEIKLNEIAIPFLGGTIYKVWQHTPNPKYLPCTIEIVDTTNGHRSAAATFYEMLTFGNYTEDSGRLAESMGGAPVMLRLYQDSIGQEMHIREFTAEGTTAGKWTLINPQIQNVQFSAVDYGSDEFAVIKATFQYSKFRYETSNLFNGIL